jgi:hypothetical protein
MAARTISTFSSDIAHPVSLHAWGGTTAHNGGLSRSRLKSSKYFPHLDPDGQHPPDQLPRILQPTWENRADLVLGSRFTHEGDVPGSEFRSSPLRRVWMHVLARLLSGIHGQRFTDITSGFRAGNHRAIGLFTRIYQPDFAASPLQSPLRSADRPLRTESRHVPATFPPDQLDFRRHQRALRRYESTGCVISGLPNIGGGKHTPATND